MPFLARGRGVGLGVEGGRYAMTTTERPPRGRSVRSALAPASDLVSEGGLVADVHRHCGEHQHRARRAGAAGVLRQRSVPGRDVGSSPLAAARPFGARAGLPIQRRRPRRLCAVGHRLVHRLHGGGGGGPGPPAREWAPERPSRPCRPGPRPSPRAGPESGPEVALLTMAAVILAVLGGMAVCARPTAREQRHDRYELTHRYGGWLSVVLFAGLTVLMAARSGDSIVAGLVASPGTWIVLAVAVFVAIPWLQLRHVAVSVVTPSDHVALVTLDRGRRVRPGTASRIARRPLGQWHAFADMPSRDAGASRMAVSRGGDWTARFIADRPDLVWVRGVPTAGVVTVARLFHRVVWVATGSGIAPCLPQLLCDPTPARLVWVTRNPERTYGPELVGEILAAQLDTIVWDTDAYGQPDLAGLAYRVCRDTGAEAVICISNKRTTLRLVAQLRQRGMTAVGPIWDS